MTILQKQTTYFLFGLTLFVLVVLDMYWWIKVSINKPFLQAKREYLQIFPEFLQNGKTITLLNIIFLAVASVLFHKNRNNKKIKLHASILFWVSIVLISWNLFSLM